MSCEWIRTGKNSCHWGCSEATWATGSGSSFCSSRGEHVLNVWVWLSLIRERGKRKLKCHSSYVTYSLWKSLSPTSWGLTQLQSRWGWPTCGGQQQWGPPARHLVLDDMLLWTPVSWCPCQKGHWPHHPWWLFYHLVCFIPLQNCTVDSEPEKLGRSLHRGLKKLGSGVDCTVYQLCSYGYVISCSWLGLPHL